MARFLWSKKQFFARFFVCRWPFPFSSLRSLPPFGCRTAHRFLFSPSLVPPFDTRALSRRRPFIRCCATKSASCLLLPFSTLVHLSLPLFPNHSLPPSMILRTFFLDLLDFVYRFCSLFQEPSHENQVFFTFPPPLQVRTSFRVFFPPLPCQEVSATPLLPRCFLVYEPFLLRVL